MSAASVPRLSIKRTYRLRVSTSPQYESSPEILDERFLQERAYDNEDTTSHEGDIMLLKEEGDSEQLLHGRMLRKNLNIPLIKNWIRTCFKECKLEDAFHSQDATARPARVIDTRRLMIRRTPPDCEYVALSYTWGPKSITQLQLTKDNEPRLAKAQGLNEAWDMIPRTIQDAIDLCRRLGIRYLWVDALCRGKGDGYANEKAVKDIISRIFANACLTIVANGPDSHYGLPGVRSSCSPWRCQVSRQVGQLSLAVAKHRIDQAMSNSGWRQRGWTYEEWLVSRHMLILADDQAFFCCRAGERIYSEDTYDEVPLSDLKPVIFTDSPQIDEFWSFHKNWAGRFAEYAELSAEYANRHMTNEDDLSSGFGMTKKKLETWLGQQYYHDLPLDLFAQALCFAILKGRRRSSLPSWSWQGWNVSGESGLDYESTWGFRPSEYLATFFYPSKSPISRGFEFELIALRSRSGHECVSSLFPDNEPPCPLIIDALPTALKQQLLVISTRTVELFAYIDGEAWIVALQDGFQTLENVGDAILNLPDNRTNKGYFKFVFIGDCCPDKGGEWYKFFLVVAPCGYANVFCRVGCSVNIQFGKVEERLKHEMIYLI
ncbi:uncharacterized protein Aud_009442 [Aspergillus udagawae]|uniref:Heterokaryon incompatibility domain-containing protein n=1 Tax=Aspergillus udagawae TaxID=91492 RepID=A0A8E0R217_9EURO|nr:uncharacterized protein Aud_009442 [Aspergillus udagawae]GIC92963.1 hypothetical protein Aud_009442 [Aspergillus udagawae]